MNHETLVHKGSTKDVYRKGDHYLFKFSDRYSVFDWGEMPDHLEGKGEALARFTKSVYKELKKNGIAHHLVEGECGPNEILVTPFEVVRDGSSLAEKENVFIPLEIIFRMGYAKGSSLRKRMQNLEDWKTAGFTRSYSELEMFDRPMIDFTTKLERFDRPLATLEAKKLSGLNDSEWEQLLKTTSKIAETLKVIFNRHDVILWDGKIELALGKFKGANREIVLVDSIGPDELRLSKDNVQLSKEVIRQYYRKTEWYGQLDEAKEKYKTEFKEFIAPPPKLPESFKKTVEDLYTLLPLLIENTPEVGSRLQRLMSRLGSAL